MSWAEDLALAQGDPEARVPGDPEAAARVLVHVVAFLRRRKRLPRKLAKYLADAFEVAAAKETAEERVTMLGRELNLVRETPGRPLKATIDDVRRAETCVVFDDGVDYSRTAVLKVLMRQTGVKERTAWQRLKDLDQGKEDAVKELQKRG